MCAVAAQPGHTKELQTVQLERGLKIIDSPGVVFDDDDFDDGKSKRKSNVLLRNVVKVEDIDVPPRGRSRDESARSLRDDASSAHTESPRSRKNRPGAGREKLAILPNEAAPIGMLANLSLRKSRRSRSSRSRSVSTADDNEYGVANEDYFRASSKSYPWA